MSDKIRSQNLTHLDSRKCSPTVKIARAVANKCRSSRDGAVVDEVVVVEINSYAVVESIYKPCLLISTSTIEVTPLRRECWEGPMPHAADSIVGRSPTLFVYLSATFPPTPVLHTRGCLTTVFQPMAPMPHHAQLNKRRIHLHPRLHTSRFKSTSSRNCRLTPQNAPALSHWTGPTSARSSSPFLLKFLRAVLMIQSQGKWFEFNAEGMVVVDAMSAEELIIHSFNQHRWRYLLWKMAT